jgi:hypothetical protein
MLPWENSGRGKFEQLKNIVINDNDHTDFLERNIHVIQQEIQKEKLNLPEKNEIMFKF